MEGGRTSSCDPPTCSCDVHESCVCLLLRRKSRSKRRRMEDLVLAFHNSSAPTQRTFQPNHRIRANSMDAIDSCIVRFIPSDEHVRCTSIPNLDVHRTTTKQHGYATTPFYPRLRSDHRWKRAPRGSMFRATSRRGALRKTRTALEEEGGEDEKEPAKAFTKRKRVVDAKIATVDGEHETVGAKQRKESTTESAMAFEEASKDATEAQANADVGTDGMYHGMAKYKDYRAGFRREDTAKAADKYGPKRAPDNVRRTVLVDYQPDICKDYKETGYCGYGDSCKFLHDRGDYKLGWQLDRDWEEKMRRERELAQESEEEDQEGEEDSLPFACLKCRTQWKDLGTSLGDPVVTRCGHYFCEHCALKHNAISKKCFVCNQPTSGVFNTAHEVLKKYKG